MNADVPDVSEDDEEQRYIDSLVASAPRPTPEQVRKLLVLLSPS